MTDTTIVEMSSRTSTIVFKAQNYNSNALSDPFVEENVGVWAKQVGYLLARVVVEGEVVFFLATDGPIMPAFQRSFMDDG